MQTELNAFVLADLHAAATAAHQRYSQGHAQHAEAAVKLEKAGTIRSRLVKDLDSSRKALRDARRSAIGAAIAGDVFSEASARVAAVENESVLLDLALKRFHAFEYQDALRESLALKMKTLDAQYRSEGLRLQCKLAEIELGLSAVAMNNHGHMEIQMGSVTRPYEELIARVGREADAAREALKNHDAEMRKLRDEVGEL